MECGIDFKKSEAGTWCLTSNAAQLIVQLHQQCSDAESIQCTVCSTRRLFRKTALFDKRQMPPQPQQERRPSLLCAFCNVRPPHFQPINRCIRSVCFQRTSTILTSSLCLQINLHCQYEEREKERLSDQVASRDPHAAIHPFKGIANRDRAPPRYTFRPKSAFRPSSSSSTSSVSSSVSASAFLASSSG